MPINKKYLAEFEFGSYYHIYNRTNNNELLFWSDKNRIYFLKLLDSYMSSTIDLYAWNLMPNHFHFIIKIKDKADILQNLDDRISIGSRQKFLNDGDVNKLVRNNFKRFFASYSMAFNKINSRNGNLFHRTFKRVHIVDSAQLIQAIIYVNCNAQKHKMYRDFINHKWTSYHNILSDKPTNVSRNEVLQCFGGRNEFIRIHEIASKDYYDPFVMIEDL